MQGGRAWIWLDCSRRLPCISRKRLSFTSPYGWRNGFLEGGTKEQSVNGVLALGKTGGWSLEVKTVSQMGVIRIVRVRDSGDSNLMGRLQKENDRAKRKLNKVDRA